MENNRTCRGLGLDLVRAGKKIQWTETDKIAVIAHLARHKLNRRNCSTHKFLELATQLGLNRSAEFNDVVHKKLKSSLLYRLGELLKKGHIKEIGLHDQLSVIWPPHTRSWVLPGWPGAMGEPPAIDWDAHASGQELDQGPGPEAISTPLTPSVYTSSAHDDFAHSHDRGDSSSFHLSPTPAPVAGGIGGDALQPNTLQELTRLQTELGGLIMAEYQSAQSVIAQLVLAMAKDDGPTARRSMEALDTAADAIDRHMSRYEKAEGDLVEASPDLENGLIISLRPDVSWVTMYGVVTMHLELGKACVGNV